MKLTSLLDEKGIAYEKHSHARAYTAQRLAAEEHVTGYMVAKPVIVKAGEKFVMCVLPAPKHLDLSRVSELLAAPDARLATESEMAELFPDCELGAEPPVGSLFNMQTVMDASLEEDEHLVMQAGTHTESVRLRRDDWQRLCQPRVATITLD